LDLIIDLKKLVLLDSDVMNFALYKQWCNYYYLKESNFNIINFETAIQAINMEQPLEPVIVINHISSMNENIEISNI